MNAKAKLVAVLEAAVAFLDCPDVDEVADFLIKNGVTVIPEGAIILTKEEIARLNEYQEKHFVGGVDNGCKQ